MCRIRAATDVGRRDFLTCIARSSRNADPGRDEAATATGSQENGSRVVELISSKGEGGRAIRIEVEHVPLRRQGIECLLLW